MKNISSCISKNSTGVNPGRKNDRKVAHEVISVNSTCIFRSSDMLSQEISSFYEQVNT